MVAEAGYGRLGSMADRCESAVADHCKQGELDEVLEVDALAFGHRSPEALYERWRSVTDIERVIVSRDGGRIVGSAISTSTAMTLPGGGRPKTAAVVGVGVSPTNRRQGRLRAMMALQLQEFRDRGEPLAVLEASEGGIYGRYGYGPATFAHHYVIDRQSGGLDPDLSCSQGHVRIVEADAAIEAFCALAPEYVPGRVGEVDPLGTEWTDLEGLEGGDEVRQRFCAVYEQEGRIDGAIAYRIAKGEPPYRSDGRRVAVLERMLAVTSASYLSLWQFLLGLDLIGEVRTGERPVDEAVRWALADERQLKVRNMSDQSWLRLVDVASGLRLRRYGSEGSFTFELKDAFCPWNDGRYHFEAKAGTTASARDRDSFCRDGQEAEATVERISGAGGVPDLQLDVAALASIFLGGVRPAALAQVGRIKAVSSGKLQLVEQMFKVHEAPFRTFGL